MIQVVRAILSIALLVLAWRHAHWSVALTLVLTLLACEVLSSLVWTLKIQVIDLQQRVRALDEKVDAIKDR